MQITATSKSHNNKQIAKTRKQKREDKTTVRRFQVIN